MLKPIQEYGVAVLFALIVSVLVLHYRSTHVKSEEMPCLKNAAGELCLDQSTPYAEVPSANQPPQALTQRPAALQEQLPIVRVTYDQLTSDMQHQLKTHPVTTEKKQPVR